ncbi:LYR motif-containing protein [Trichinella spiralis]|uniref:LYR motif-containing protein n=1 Tax=Trichinella spiralis TaxID=6334 RepID=A0ABR3KF84_TRISP
MSKNLKTIEIDDTDQDIEETVAERLIGLTEMLPEGMQKAIFTICSTASELGRKLFVFTRSAMWIAASRCTCNSKIKFCSDLVQQLLILAKQVRPVITVEKNSLVIRNQKIRNTLDVEYEEASARLVQIHFESWKKWTNSSNRGNNISDKEAKRYIVEEARRLFKQNKTLANPIEIEELIREGRTRIAIAVHYGNPYPRPVYAFPKTLPIRKVSNQQTEKQSLP